MGLDAPQVEDPHDKRKFVMTQKGVALYIIVGFIALSLVVSGCARREPPKPKEDETPQAESSAAPGTDPVQHKVLSFNLEGFTDKGAKKWDVTGQSAEAISPTEVKLDNITAKAYGDEAEATITADKGVYDKAKNSVRLEQNVKATIQNAGGMTGDFPGLPANPNDPAKPGEPAKEKTKKKKDTVITCDGDVRFDYENNVAYFNKNVIVVTEDGTIIADMITVNLDPVSKKMKEIVAEGNVKILKEGNTIYSEKATYVEAEKKVVLTGRPKIIIASDSGLDTNFLGAPITEGKK